MLQMTEGFGVFLYTNHWVLDPLSSTGLPYTHSMIPSGLLF